MTIWFLIVFAFVLSLIFIQFFQTENYNVDYEFKYGEDNSLKEVREYIQQTYSQHYAQGKKVQAMECITDAGHKDGFCIGNIIKYAMRYGKKKGKNKDDLLKIIHYTLILMEDQSTEKGEYVS